MTEHLALLGAEAALCSGVVLLLFRLRSRIGMAPLYMVLGALQYLQFVFASSLRIEAWPGVTVGPATVVLFPLTVFVVLLTYVEDDVLATRNFTYAVVVCNVTLYAVAALAGRHITLPGVSNPLQLPLALFQQPGRVIAASCIAIVIDMAATVVIFEWVSRRVTVLFLRLVSTAVAVMVIDTVMFSTIAFAGHPVWLGVMTGSILGKVGGAAIYAGIVTWYIRTFENQADVRDGGAGANERWLTYRQRYEEARTLMSRDALTGLYNRRFFDDFAPRQIAHVDRSRHPMAFVLVDIDCLKAANDRHGHHAGDELVRCVANELRQMVRASDAACRYGGDEFVVVLTTADEAAATVFAERLVANIRARSQQLVPVPPWAPATVTIGIAVAPRDGIALEPLMRTADQRMYDGKRRGGGVVVGSTGDEAVTGAARSQA